LFAAAVGIVVVLVSAVVARGRTGSLADRVGIVVRIRDHPIAAHHHSVQALVGCRRRLGGSGHGALMVVAAVDVGLLRPSMAQIEG
jgi:hypothetical protein